MYYEASLGGLGLTPSELIRSPNRNLKGKLEHLTHDSTILKYEPFLSGFVRGTEACGMGRRGIRPVRVHDPVHRTLPIGPLWVSRA